jgi:hypothetical protein
MKNHGIATFAWIALSCAVARNAAAAPSQDVCAARVNDTAAKVVECIQQASLWHHLAAFQHIANQNPGRTGHPNRNTGTPGYKASVDYVAALMRQAGYKVTIQPYAYREFSMHGVPAFSAPGQSYVISRDWFVARLSGSGTLAGPVQPVGTRAAMKAGGAGSGCSGGDFAGFDAGNIALMQRGSCAFDTQVSNAQAAGAAAVVIYNSKGDVEESGHGARDGGGAFEARLTDAADIPVVGVASHAVGDDLVRRYVAGETPTARIDIQTDNNAKGIDYNLIADSPYGDPGHVVVVDAHLDAIYGAGMLDNASGSTTILETALMMAKTRTRNQLRYIWFGGEELGLLGSHYYTRTLTPEALHRIAFDIDVDVTATPNFDILIADAKFAHNVDRFPPNVVPQSRVGNKDFTDYFTKAGLISRAARFGNDGTDSNSFSLVGVPNTGILTQQDCCKKPWELKLWGGFRGNYEGDIPSFDGGCVDQPRRWCDNLSNNDRFVLEFVSKAVAAVTLVLANDGTLRHDGG